MYLGTPLLITAFKVLLPYTTYIHMTTYMMCEQNGDRPAATLNRRSAECGHGGKVAETAAFKGCLVEGRGECANVKKVLCFCGNNHESGDGWHVANSVRGGFIFYVCNLRRGEIFGEKGLCVPFLLGVKSPGVVEGD